MGIFFKKKKKTTEEYTFFDPQFDIEKEFSKRERKNKDAGDKKKADFTSEIEELQFIRTQCEQIVESSKYIDEVKIEYQTVNSYISDVQTFENMSEKEKKPVTDSAMEILRLEKKREKDRNRIPNLSPDKTQRFEEYEDEFPKALSTLSADEKYAQNIKHDMRILEAEKLSLKEDIKNFRKRRISIKTISIVALIIVFLVVVLFLAFGSNEKSDLTFTVVLGVVALLVALIFFLSRQTVYELKLSQKKYKRAVTLLNKAKIKYVNIANSVDYQHEKYRVKNAYQLSREYELYLEDKKVKERYLNSTDELSRAREELRVKLSKLKMYDASVWNSQIDALVDRKELDDVKHRLYVRRQKLKEQIDYNNIRIEEAKKAITDYVRDNPAKGKIVLDIMDSYDVDA